MIKGCKICGVSDPTTLKYLIDHSFPPKFIGFICNYKKSKRYVEFDKLKELLSIDKKNINPNEVLNTELLKNLRLINKNADKLKILGTGEVKDKINIEADLASKSAIEKLEKVGGSIQLKK